jgi:hypothetical protein
LYSCFWITKAIPDARYVASITGMKTKKDIAEVASVVATMSMTDSKVAASGNPSVNQFIPAGAPGIGGGDGNLICS